MMRPRAKSFELPKEAFIKSLVLRNYTALSLRQAEQAIRFFVEFLQTTGVHGVEAVETAHIEAYRKALTEHTTRKGEPLTQGTIHGRMILVKRWFKFLYKRKLVDADPARDVEIPKVQRKKLRGVLEPEEIKRVMDQPNLRSLIGYRDRTIMEVLYSTGIRAAEVSNLRVPDLNFEKKTVEIRNGKGQRDRFALLSTPAIRFLKHYLEKVRPELAAGIQPCGNRWLEKHQTGGDRLFLSAYGGPLKPNWISSCMKKYLWKAGIFKKISPVHGFRHSAATHLMEGGMDVRYVQVFLGHRQIDTTQIYTQVGKKGLKKEITAYHPVQELKDAEIVFEGGEDEFDA